MPCSICLGQTTEPIWLGCHVFCKECIVSWLHKSTCCPTCRGEVPVELMYALKPRQSCRATKRTLMFTTDGVQSSSVSSTEMMLRIENIE